MQILNFTPKELAFAERQIFCRTKFEIKAYYLLPKSMRGAVERNPLIKFDGHNDVFFLTYCWEKIKSSLKLMANIIIRSNKRNMTIIGMIYLPNMDIQQFVLKMKISISQLYIGRDCWKDCRKTIFQAHRIYLNWWIWLKSKRRRC